MLTYLEAAAVIAQYADQLRASIRPTEELPLTETLHRVLAEPVTAQRDQPPFPRSTRDGFALRTSEASQPLPITGQLRAGDNPSTAEAAPGTTIEIMTGAPVPPWADAVVMIEHVEIRDNHIHIPATLSILPGQNIVPQGAEARQGATQLTAGTRLTSAEIALAASEGRTHLRVYPQPRIAILPTGDELVPQGSQPAAGQIFDSNGPMLNALATQFGAIAKRQRATADTLEALNAALASAEDADLLLLTGGVSMGRYDLVEQALAARGAVFHFTGVKIQPGKPLVFGHIPRANRAPLYFFGLPGNPISSSVTFQIFATPILAALAGATHTHHITLAQLGEAVQTKPGLTRFLPAQLDNTTGIPTVRLTRWHGSGDLPSLTRSNCLMFLPAENPGVNFDSNLDQAQEIPPGTLIRVLPLA